MTKRPELVASDIGGTLSVEKYIIPPYTTCVLNQLVHRGIPVALVTGYNCRTALAYTGDLDSRIYLVVQNGAACIQDQRILWEHHLPMRAIEKISELLGSIGSPIFIYKGKNDDFRNYIVDASGADQGRDYICVQTLSDAKHTLGISTLVPNREMTAVRKKIGALNRGDMQIITSMGDSMSWLEVTPKRAGKNLALCRLCKSIGVSMADVVYFGDNTNDIKALEAVGYPVLVENALSELKRAFTHSVPTAAEEGVARYLSELFGLRDEKCPCPGRRDNG